MVYICAINHTISMNGGTKINQLLMEVPAGAVFLSSWLSAKGYSYELQQKYRKGGWLEPIGKGAMKRSGDRLTLEGALYSLQKQAGMKVHIGGRSALTLQGMAHYLELYAQETLLFAPRGVKLPLWLTQNRWETIPRLINTSFLTPGAGLTGYTQSGLTVSISNPARAIMECLEMAPDKFSLEEAYQLMETLSFLVPSAVQSLLEQCRSVKVTRLFLFMAKRAGHQWVDQLDPSSVNLGKGKRSMVAEGVFVPEFQITVPKALGS